MVTAVNSDPNLRKCQVYLRFPHRASAALFAIALRLCFERDLALALPPFGPPIFPNADMTRLSSSLVGADCPSLNWPVEMSPISFPSSIGSEGRLNGITRCFAIPEYGTKPDA